MFFEFKVSVEVERVSGKFTSRDEISECIIEALTDNEPDVSGVGPDGDTDYDVTVFEVEELPQTKRKRG